MGVLLSWHPIELSKAKIYRNLSNIKIATVTAQLVLENLFVFLIKEIVASRIFRLLATFSCVSPKRSNLHRGLLSKFSITPEP